MKKILVFFSILVLSAQIQAQDIQLLNRIKAANSKIKSLESDLSKTLVKSNKTIQQNGKLCFVSPNEYSAQFTTGKYMIVNEKKVKMDLGLFHGTFKRKDGSKIESLSNIFLYGFQGRIQELADENNYNLTTETKDGYHIVTGINNKKKLIGIGYKKVVFKFQTESLLINEMILTDYNGNDDTYKMTNVKYNVPIDRKIFQF